jgi:hypothetical protein
MLTTVGRTPSFAKDDHHGWCPATIVKYPIEME